jgi:uncharacterized protein YndB with AHSA1/START domain
MTPKTRFPVVRLQRTIPATPREVYQAWLDPELLRQWMAPGLEVKRAEVDARVGGHFRIWHADHDSDVGGFECEIVELVADERIVFRWGFTGPQRAPVYDSLLTITLHGAKGNATILTLVHERLDDLAAAMPDVARSVELGWELVLTKLVLVLSARSPSDSSAR